MSHDPGLRRLRAALWSRLVRWPPRALGPFGFEAFVRRPDHHYVPDYYGRSAHKHVDLRQVPGFSALAAQVIRSGNTLLYFDRLYTLYQALLNTRRHAAAGRRLTVAEVGVYRGGSTYFIAAGSRDLGLSALTLHAFDTFEGHSAEDIRPGLDQAALHTPGLFGETSFEAVSEYLRPFSNILLHKGRIQETASSVAGERFSLVHVDVDIYAPTAFALDFFGSRLVRGGMVVVDDYGFTTCPGATAAVDAFVSAHPEYATVHLLSGQCVLVRLGPEEDESPA